MEDKLQMTKEGKLGTANGKSIVKWLRGKKDQNVGGFYTYHNYRI